MIDTIKDLEREIEQFQNNVLASGELVTLLQQMLDQIKSQNEAFEQKSALLMSRVDTLPEVIEKANSENNQQIKEGIAKELDSTIKSFSNEQDRYVQGLEQTRKQIQTTSEQLNTVEESFGEKQKRFLEKLDTTIEQIKEDHIKTIDDLKKTVDKVVTDRNEEFISEQDKYISELKRTSETINEAEKTLDSSYKSFIENLEKMNIANLFEQNKLLTDELKKRTTILMIISAISVALGIIGLIL